MSGTVKTVLIVGGVAVGAYVLVKALSPAPTKNTYSVFGGSSSSTAAGITQGVIQGLGNLFSSPTPTSGYGSNNNTVIAGNPVPPNFDTSNYSVSNGFEFTDSSGNFVAG